MTKEWDYLRSFLDERLQDSPSLDQTASLIAELKDSTGKLRDELEAIEREAPTRVAATKAKTTKALNLLDAANDKREDISIALDHHLASVRHQRLRKNLSALSTNISEIQLVYCPRRSSCAFLTALVQAESYFGLVLQVSHITENINKALTEGKTGDKESVGKEKKKGEGDEEEVKKISHEDYRIAVDNFLQLKNIQHQLKPKHCPKLKSFLRETVEKAATFLLDCLQRYGTYRTIELILQISANT